MHKSAKGSRKITNKMLLKILILGGMEFFISLMLTACYTSSDKKTDTTAVAIHHHEINR